MRNVILAAATILLGTGPALSQGSAVPPVVPKPATTAAPMGTAHPAAPAAPAKPAAAASTPESRSAAALALSHEPTFDEGTAKRIKEAALSYSDIAVRGGWPTIPPEAKFAPGVQGAHDELLRKRLIITEDLAGDKASGPFDDTLAEAVKRFQ